MVAEDDLDNDLNHSGDEMEGIEKYSNFANKRQKTKINMTEKIYRQEVDTNV